MHPQQNDNYISTIETANQTVMSTKDIVMENSHLVEWLHNHGMLEIFQLDCIFDDISATHAAMILKSQLNSYTEHTMV